MEAVPNLTKIALMPIFIEIGVASRIPDVGVEPFVTVTDGERRAKPVLAAGKSGSGGQRNSQCCLRI